MGYRCSRISNPDDRVVNFLGNSNFLDRKKWCIRDRFPVCETDQTIKDADKVNQAIIDTMDFPCKYNISELLRIYKFTADNVCKLNIYRHLGILSNRGNPYAFEALGLINRKSRQAKFKYVKAEYVKNNEKTKEDIYSYNVNINKSFENCMEDIFKEGYNVENHRGNEVDYPADYLGNLKVSNQIYRTDLLRIRDIQFARDCFWFENTYPYIVANFGWKLHVSAHPQSATEISKVVLPYLLKNKIGFKICGSLDSLRILNTVASYTQQGKFITIYTNSPQQARQVSNDLDTLISEEVEMGRLNQCDFCELLGDVKIGNTGALYARLGAYTDNVYEGLDDYQVRQVPVNRYAAQHYSEFKKSPFDLDVSFLGKELNKDSANVYEEWSQEVESILEVELYEDTDLL